MGKQEKEIPEGYRNVLDGNKKLIEELGREEFSERIETADSIVNRIKTDQNNTQIQKERFISELKMGLGEKIRKNPNNVTFIKRPWYQKTFNAINKFFSKI